MTIGRKILFISIYKNLVSQLIYEMKKSSRVIRWNYAGGVHISKLSSFWQISKLARVVSPAAE